MIKGKKSYCIMFGKDDISGKIGGMILGSEAISWVSECKNLGVHNFSGKTHCCRGRLKEVLRRV